MSQEYGLFQLNKNGDKFSMEGSAHFRFESKLLTSQSHLQVNQLRLELNQVVKCCVLIGQSNTWNAFDWLKFYVSVNSGIA